MTSAHSLLTIATLTLTLTLTSNAQENAPVATLEETFTEKVDSLQKPVTERYITNLEALKKNYTSRGELGSAEAVSHEIEIANSRLKLGSPIFPSRLAPPKIEGLFNLDTPGSTTADSESDSIPRTARGDIKLSPAKADLSGGTKLLTPQEIIQGFVQKGAAATWTISEIPPGTYEIIIDYSAGSKNGGGNIHVAALTSEADIEITPLGTWKNFRRKRIGGIRVTTPPLTLKISTNSAKTAAGAMALRQVVLRPRP